MNAEGGSPEPYVVNKYTHSPGIHYENIGNVNFYNDEWNLVTYIDVKHFDQRYEQIEIFNTITVKLCKNPLVSDYRWTACNQFVTTVEQNLRQIKSDKDLVRQLLGTEVNNRPKRGLINFIGQGAKLLFGVLDEADADYYNTKIDELQNNEDVVANLVKQQTNVVQSTILTLNKTIGDVEYNEQLLRQSIEKVNKHINDADNMINKSLNFFHFKTDVEEHIAIITLMLNQYQDDLTHLITAILSAQRGVIHPYIMTPAQLVHELKGILPYIPTSLTFPLPLSEDNAHSLLLSVRVTVFVKMHRLIMLILVPLIRPDDFTLFRLTPFPVHLEGDKYLFIKPGTTYLAIDKVKQHYTTINPGELSDCKEIVYGKHICQQSHPMYLTHVNEACEVKLYQFNTAIPQDCDKRLISLERSFWFQLQASNSWLFVLPKPESVTISCTASKNHKKPIDVLLEGTGSLTLNQDCKAYGQSAMLTPKSSYSSETLIDFVPPFDIQIDCCDELKEKYNLNITTLKLNTVFRNTMNHIEDLNVASHRLNDINTMIEQSLHKDKWHHAFNHYSIITYIFVTLVILAFCYCLCTRCCKKCFDEDTVSCCKGKLANFSICIDNRKLKTSNEDLMVTYDHRSSITEFVSEETPLDEASNRPRFERIAGRRPIRK